MKRWQDVEETCSRNGVVQVVENQAQSPRQDDKQHEAVYEEGGGERGRVWSGSLKEDVNNGEEMKKRKGLKIWILVG